MRNVSGKTIISFDIHLVIQKQGKMPANVGIPINFRSSLGLVSEKASPENSSKNTQPLKPSESVKVKVRKSDLLYWMGELNKFEVTQIEKLYLDIRFVYFDDKTRWVLGQHGLVPDPMLNLKKKRVEPDISIFGMQNIFSPVDWGGCSRVVLGVFGPAISRLFFVRRTEASACRRKLRLVRCGRLRNYDVR